MEWGPRLNPLILWLVTLATTAPYKNHLISINSGVVHGEGVGFLRNNKRCSHSYPEIPKVLGAHCQEPGRSFWIGMGPTSSKCPYKRQKKSNTDTEEKCCEDGGRVGRDTASGQGMPGAPRRRINALV